tara:strand:- start:43 stop:2283 length:2241 start_codon:yes stop_codon:yes gene_type:complete
MIIKKGIVIVLSLVSAVLMANESFTYRQELSFRQPEIKEIMVRATEHELAKYDGFAPANWLTGTLYVGIFECYKVTGKTFFLDTARDWANVSPQKSIPLPYHGDAICAFQTGLDIYLEDPDPALIATIKKEVDEHYFVERVPRKELGHAYWEEESRPLRGRNIWWWCDSLFMAPPVFPRLSQITGDPKYNECLHELYWDDVAYLYNKEEGLFYRDHTYFDKKSPNGKMVAWSRGQGWVIGGLVRVIEFLPDEDPMKEKYIALFRDMINRLLALQGEDGLWGASVNDREWHPEPETSGSSFFLYALAAGINMEILDAKTYLPPLVKGWDALMNCVRYDGKVEWAQLEDGSPNKVRKTDDISYTQGAFLLAAAQVYQLNLTPSKYKKIMGERERRVVFENGYLNPFGGESIAFVDAYKKMGKYCLARICNEEGNSGFALYLMPDSRGLRLFQQTLGRAKRVDFSVNSPALIELATEQTMAVYPDAKGFKTQIHTPWASAPKFTGLSGKITDVQLGRFPDGKIALLYKNESGFVCVSTTDDSGESWSASKELLQAERFRTAETKEGLFLVVQKKAGLFFYNVTENGLTEKSKITAEARMLYDFEAGSDELFSVVFDDENGVYQYASRSAASSSWSLQQLAPVGTLLPDGYAAGATIDPEDVTQVYIASDLNPKTGNPNGTRHYQMYKAQVAQKAVSFEPITFDFQSDNIRPVAPRNRSAAFREMVVWHNGEYRSAEDYDLDGHAFVEKK